MKTQMKYFRFEFQRAVPLFRVYFCYFRVRRHRHVKHSIY